MRRRSERDNPPTPLGSLCLERPPRQPPSGCQTTAFARSVASRDALPLGCRREENKVRLGDAPHARTPEEAHTQSTPLRLAKSRSSPNPSINDRTRSHRKRPGVFQGKETFLLMLMVGLKREIGRFPGVQLDRAHTDQRLFYTTRCRGQVESPPMESAQRCFKAMESRSGQSIKAM